MSHGTPQTYSIPEDLAGNFVSFTNDFTSFGAERRDGIVRIWTDMEMDTIEEETEILDEYVGRYLTLLGRAKGNKQ